MAVFSYSVVTQRRRHFPSYSGLTLTPYGVRQLSHAPLQIFQRHARTNAHRISIQNRLEGTLMLALPLRLRLFTLRPGILSKPSWPAPASYQYPYRPFSTTNSTLSSAAMSQPVEIPRPEPEPEVDIDIDIPEDEARRKRVKIGDEGASANATVSATVAADDDAAAQALKEAEVGITGFVSAEGSGFVGIVKKRCDFLFYDGCWTASD